MQPSTQKQTLSFPDAERLWSFIVSIEHSIYRINGRSFKLVCECSKDDLMRATEQYSATIANNAVATM